MFGANFDACRDLYPTSTIANFHSLGMKLINLCHFCPYLAAVSCRFVRKALFGLKNNNFYGKYAQNNKKWNFSIMDEN